VTEVRGGARPPGGGREGPGSWRELPGLPPGAG